VRSDDRRVLQCLAVEIVADLFRAETVQYEEITLAFSFAVPMMRRPGILSSAAVA